MKLPEENLRSLLPVFLQCFEKKSFLTVNNDFINIEHEIDDVAAQEHKGVTVTRRLWIRSLFEEI